MVPPKKGRGIPNSLIKSVFTFCLEVITITMVNIAKISKNIAPVQLVEVVDGEGQAEHVDQNPKQVQHVVAVRALRNHHNCGFCSNRILHYFPMSVCVLVSPSQA